MSAKPMRRLRSVIGPPARGAAAVRPGTARGSAGRGGATVPAVGEGDGSLIMLPYRHAPANAAKRGRRAARISGSFSVVRLHSVVDRSRLPRSLPEVHHSIKNCLPSGDGRHTAAKGGENEVSR